jgi:signal transduction histidine kinase
VEAGGGPGGAGRQRAGDHLLVRRGGRDAGGTGLGLAISRDIAEAHGGSLILTDRIDGTAGARFVLRLPRAETAD